MAIKIDAGDGVKRGELFSVNPFEIILEDGSNVRHGALADAKVAKMVESIRSHGQLQPISVRRLPSKKIQVFAGYTRVKALRILATEDPRWQAKVQVFDDVNDQDAFLRGLAENIDRNEMTLIDHSYAIGQLIEQFGYTIEMTAKFYGWSRGKVLNVKKLKGLPVKIQEQVANGSKGLVEALLLLKLTPEEQAEVLGDEGDEDAPKGKNGTAKKAAKVARSKGIKISRTASDLRKLLDGRTDPTSLALLAFLKGEGTDDEVTEALDAYYDAPEVTGVRA